MDAQALPARQTRSLHRFANPGRFLRLARALQPWLTIPAILILGGGLLWGLLLSPADWQQGDSVRIMYVHVPAAWLASAGYASRVVQGGPMLDRDGRPCGSLLLVEVEDLAAAEGFAASDPYAKAGLFESTVIRGFRTVFRDGEAAG